MTSRAEKMRNKLGNIAKEREQFEMKRKELEQEMNKGKAALGEIKKGLKHHVIGTGDTFDEDDKSSGPSKGAKISPTPAGRLKVNGADKSATMSPLLTPTAGVSSVGGINVAMPSGPRLSEWCWTGALDSMPPVVKEQTLYEVTRLLGRGAFGEVNLVKNREDNKLFAIKTILCTQESDLGESLMEVRNLRQNRHACIIDICDVFLTDKPAKVLHIAMSYCEAGDLGKIITSNKKNNSFVQESQVLKWMTQIAMALEYVHSNNFIHRDLKPCNVLLCEGGQYVKLGDFGLALQVKKEGGGGASTSEAGTPLYTAPEIIKSLPYSYPVDCWSFGVMLYELTSLRPPFNGSSTTELVKAIVGEEYQPPPLPEHYSEGLKALCMQLLQRDPVKRITMVEILQHPTFFQKAHAFPPSYRPINLEERVRRCYTKQMQQQLETLPFKHETILAARILQLAEQQEALELLQKQQLEMSRAPSEKASGFGTPVVSSVDRKSFTHSGLSRDAQGGNPAATSTPSPSLGQQEGGGIGISRSRSQLYGQGSSPSAGSASVCEASDPTEVPASALLVEPVASVASDAASPAAVATAPGSPSPVKGGRVGKHIAEAQEASKALRIPSDADLPSLAAASEQASSDVTPPVGSAASSASEEPA